MEKLIMLENGLIPVYKNEEGNKLVSARVLYEFLGVRKDFTSWIKDRIEKFDFKENDDYVVSTENGENPSAGGRPKAEYILKLDTAKEIAMVQNNSKGSEIRKYFISIEKKFTTIAKPMTIEELIILQAKSVGELKNKVTLISESHDKLEERFNNLDATNITGTPRQRLKLLVDKYSYDKGVTHSTGWSDFKSSFNIAYHTNIELKKKSFMNKNKFKTLTNPDYLERVGQIEDALRVADKMLHEVKR